MTDTEERTRLVVATNQLFDEYEELIADLAPEEWTVQSLCPAWTVRQCIAHTVAVEDVLTGWEPSTENPPPFEKMNDLVEESTSMSEVEFAARVSAILEARRDELKRLGAADLERPSITPVGVQTYGRFLAIRVFDLWVHIRDCTIPLGRETNDGGDPAELAVDEVERSIGYIVGKKIGLPDSMSIRFDLTGPVFRSIAVVVDGRARAVGPADLDDPDVVVTADSTAFVMLACGRLDPQEMIDAGRISWSGNAEWGEKAARNLRFTM